jgi:hypothetical protein
MASNEPVMAGSKTRHFKYTTNETGVTIAHVDGSNTRTFAIGDLPPEMIARLAIHGLKQKLSDDVAAEPDTAAKVIGQSATFAKLQSGVWIERAQSDPNGLTRAQVEFAETAAKVFNKSVEDIKAALLAMEPDSENAAGNTVAGQRTLYIREKSKGKKMAAALAELAVEKARIKARNAKAAAKGESEVETL